MNGTDYYTQSLNTWSVQSLPLAYTSDQKPLLIFSIAFGICILLHSIYKNGMTYKKVQIITELSCVGMIGSGVCYLICLDEQCDLITQTVVNNMIANCFFGLISQICDNYATFERYNKVVGNTSILHKRLVFCYIVVFLTLTWFPLYTFLPIWYDLNTDSWINIIEIFDYTYLCSYFLYNNYYLAQLCYKIHKISSNVLSTSNIYLLEIIICSIFHMMFSTIGVSLYVFNLPDGAIEQVICISGSIHMFINYKLKIVDFMQKVSSTMTNVSSKTSSQIHSIDVVNNL